MNNNLKSTMALAVGIWVLTGCNNDKTTSGTTMTDSTSRTGMHTDSMATNMKGDTMQMMDNGLMRSMNSMMDRMASVKMTGDFDIDYANSMIEHHQGAIDMANLELAKGADPKMKDMAQAIVTKQTGEIAALREFVRGYKPSGMKHGEGALQKLHAEMMTSMKGMTMTGHMDKDFATLMIAHHQGGMKMSKAQLANGMSASLKNMAKKGISHETKEVEEFKKWLSTSK